MIRTYKQALDLLSVHPEIDPKVFWPSVGIEPDAIYEVGLKIAAQFAVHPATVMMILETGATLARPEVVKAPS